VNIWYPVFSSIFHSTSFINEALHLTLDTPLERSRHTLTTNFDLPSLFLLFFSSPGAKWRQSERKKNVGEQFYSGENHPFTHLGIKVM
jgi:hypothetical protein